MSEPDTPDTPDTPEPVQPMLLVLTERTSRTAQVAQILARAQEKGEPIRVRVPVTLYDYGSSRTYTQIKTAVWNLQLPSDTTTVEMIEELVRVLGVCVEAIALYGTDKVEGVLSHQDWSVR